MAVKGNSSDKAVVNERKLFVGPALISVVACNPSQTEMVAMGLKAEKDPEYVTEVEGVKKVRIDFYVQNKDLKTKLTFFLEDKERANKDGDKWEFINNVGQSTWGTSVKECIAKEGKNGNTWFKPEGARKALVGEVDFYNFIKNWANVSPYEECMLDDIKALFKGNFKELQGLVKMLAANTVWAMATVNEKNYQNINNKCFGRATSKMFPKTFSDFAKKQAESENGKYALKDKWSVEFKEYVPVPVFADQDPSSDVTPAATEDIF
jgi:hypothetical protein